MRDDVMREELKRAFATALGLSKKNPGTTYRVLAVMVGRETVDYLIEGRHRLLPPPGGPQRYVIAREVITR